MKTNMITVFYALFILIAISTPSWALTITVTNTNDAGPGSLRQAVSDARLSAENDLIEFDPELSGQTILLTSGAINASGHSSGVLTIKGLGRDKLTISGNNESPAFNALDATMIISSLKITDTTPIAVDAYDEYYPTSEGALKISDCIITNSVSGAWSTSDLVVDNCEITSNTGTALLVSADGLSVQDSTISNNGTGIRTGAFGGLDEGDGGADTRIYNSSISNNRLSGIIASEGSLVISNSTISNNGSDGIQALWSARIVIENSAINNNGRGIYYEVYDDAPYEDGELREFGGPGFLSIAHTTISGNSGNAAKGGGIFLESSRENSQYDNPYINLTHVTLTNNSATEQGGGILLIPIPDLNGAHITFHVNNSIIAGNHAPINPDLQGQFISSGSNIIGDPGTSSGFEADIIEADINKILDTALNNNGGSTKTHLLVTGSPAIDSASIDYCPYSESDQRGISRPQGNSCDIGAVELGGNNVPDDELQCAPPRVEYGTQRSVYYNSCAGGTFDAYSLADLEAYKSSNFGAKLLFGNVRYQHNGNVYKNLKIKASLGSAGDILDIKSPCRIIVNAGVNLAGDFVSLDGRAGVWMTHSTIQSKGAVCLLSGGSNVKIKGDSDITAKRLLLHAAREAKIGRRNNIDVSDSLIVRSTAPLSNGRAIVSRDSKLSVGSDMIVSSQFISRIRRNTQLDVGGNLSIQTFTRYPGRYLTELKNRAVIDRSTDILVGGNMNLTSAGTNAYAMIKNEAAINVEGNLEMSIAQPSHCRVAPSASVSYASKSGTCAEILP